MLKQMSEIGAIQKLHRQKGNLCTLVTRIEDPWLLLATLPLFHPVQALKMTPLLQFTPIHFLKSTPLLLFKPVCNFGALLGLGCKFDTYKTAINA